MITEDKLITIFGIVLAIAAMAGLISTIGWKAAGCVYVMFWAQNISNRHRG